MLHSSIEFARICALTAQCLERYSLSLTGPTVVGLSGGKDSTVLALALCAMGVDVRGVIVDMGYANFNAHAIMADLSRRGIEVRVVQARTAAPALAEPRMTAALKIVSNPHAPAPCTACSRLKRHFLHQAAIAVGSRFVLLGHHREDFVATLLKDYYVGHYYVQLGCYNSGAFVEHVGQTPINVGELEAMVDRREAATMAVALPMGTGVELVRPLVLVPEDEIASLVKAEGIAVMGSGCSHEIFTQGERVPVTKREIVHARLREMLRQSPQLGDQLITIALRSLGPTGRPLCNPRMDRAARLPGFDLASALPAQRFRGTCPEVS